MSQKTLVIILAETRASEITYNSFANNLLANTLSVINDPYDPYDLCVCIGQKGESPESVDPFYEQAKYRFIFDETAGFETAMDEAMESILADNSADSNTRNIRHWKEYIRIPDQFMGGLVKQPDEGTSIEQQKPHHKGSAGILLFFRWFLLKNLRSHGLIQKYDRFIITRSDFVYMIPHCPLDLLDPTKVWVPFGEHYGGYTDRHAVLSKTTVETYLNILEEMILNRELYYEKMATFAITANPHGNWNLERLIKFHLEMQGCAVGQIPYIMYSVRGCDGCTRWSVGEYSEELGYYIKYPLEHYRASYYDAISGGSYSADECRGVGVERLRKFYEKELQYIKGNLDKDPICNR
jgi:hypothetical protein